MRHLLPIACAALLGLTGCQGVTLTINKPKAEVEATRVTETSGQGARVVTRVSLSNPNRAVLPLIEAHYTVEVEGAGWFRFTEVPGKALPGQGEQTLELPAAFATGGDSLAGRPYTVRGWVSYRPPGEAESVFYQSGLPLPRASFRREGTLK